MASKPLIYHVKGNAMTLWQGQVPIYTTITWIFCKLLKDLVFLLIALKGYGVQLY